MEAAALLQVLSEQKTLAALDRAVAALSEIGLALTQEDAIQAYGTDAIRTDLAADLGGISTKPFDELDAYVTERLILSGVYKSSNWMDGLEFLNLLAYPAAGAAREKAAKAVTGTKYNSETALKAAIDAALQPSNTGGGTGGSTGSAGGGTGGFSAPDTGLAVDVGETPSTGEMDDIFPDVDRSHYAFDDINDLRWHDVVAGDDTGYFNPDRAVTRAEAVKMLCRVFGVESAEEYAFGDVQSGSWYYGFVGGVAYKNGLVLGGSDGLFNPDAFITREDLAVLIWRFAAFAGSPFPEGGMQFADSGSVSGYALEAVNWRFNGRRDHSWYGGRLLCAAGQCRPGADRVDAGEIYEGGGERSG